MTTPAPTADAGAIAPAAGKDAGASSQELDRTKVEALVNPGKLPPYDGPTGSVEGTVWVKGPDAPEVPGLDFTTCPSGLDTYGKLFRSGPARADGLRPLADAVVVVTGYGGYVPEQHDAERVTITANCGYPRRTLALTFGQRIEIASDSKLPFAPVLSGIYQAAVMIVPPQRNGDPVKLYPPRPGHFMLGDQMQSFVTEAVLVLLQPLHAVTDLNGHFRIDGVPAGKVKVGAQLDALGSRGVQVDLDVRPNVVESAEIDMTYTVVDAGTPARLPKMIP